MSRRGDPQQQIKHEGTARVVYAQRDIRGVFFGDFLLRQKVTRCSRIATSETL